MNVSEKYTDAQLAELEIKIKKAYKEAADDLELKAIEYLEEYEERYLREYEKYKQGYYTETDWMLWKQTQIARGDRWYALRDDMAKRVTESNLIAAAYINDTTPGIYSINHNYSLYCIDKAIDNEITDAWNLVNEQEVKMLIMDDVEFFPVSKASVNVAKDEQWNRKKIQNAVLQKTLQGGSIQELAKNFRAVAKMSENSAMRNARTATTMASQAGRNASFEQAKAKGIDLKKEWVAGHDARTRDSHAEIDGVQVEVEELFPNGLRHPGDRKGRPEEVYNCRCSIIGVIPGVNNINDSGHSVESYKKWEQSQIKLDDIKTKNNKRKELDKTARVGTIDVLPKELVQGFRENLKKSNPIVKNVIEYASKKSRFAISNSGDTYYRRGVVYFGKKNNDPSSVAHELTHFIDDLTKGSRKIKTAMINDCAALVLKSGENGIEKYIKKKYRRMFIEGELVKSYRGITDIISAMTYGEVYMPPAHNQEYWMSSKYNDVAEVFAQFGRIYYNNDDDAITIFKELFPNIDKECSRIIGGIKLEKQIL